MFLKSIIKCLFIFAVALTLEFIFVFKIELTFDFITIIKSFLFLYFSPFFCFFIYLLYINSKDEGLKKTLFYFCMFIVVISYLYSFFLHCFFTSISQIFTE